MQVKSVIGLAFGDEGKGLVTDYLCRKTSNKALVVRYSGGHQVGHTVTNRADTHTFSNFGSGTCVKVPTFFAEGTYMYPKTLFNEYEILTQKGYLPRLYLHPLVRVTTCYDVAFGRAREIALNHGSVGLGIGATAMRFNKGYHLYVLDLEYPEVFEQKLQKIKEFYEEEARIHNFTKRYQHHLTGQEMFFKNAIENIHSIYKIKNYSFLREFEELIFEGSQGVLLDQEFGIFPNVTYSKLTSDRINNILLQVPGNVTLPIIDSYYVTRCYLTRHGNGWMPEKPITLINNENETNQESPWQGQLRVGELDYNILRQALDFEAAVCPNREINMVITCLDQRPGFEFDYSMFPDVHRFYTNSSPIGDLKWVNLKQVC